MTPSEVSKISKVSKDPDCFSHVRNVQGIPSSKQRVASLFTACSCECATATVVSQGVALLMCSCAIVMSEPLPFALNVWKFHDAANFFVAAMRAKQRRQRQRFAPSGIGTELIGVLVVRKHDGKWRTGIPRRREGGRGTPSWFFVDQQAQRRDQILYWDT